MGKKIRPIAQCVGCARNKRSRCEVLNETSYFWERYGHCFAMVDEGRANEIERELVALTGRAKGERI